MGQRIMLDVHDVDPNSLRFVRQELSCEDSVVGDFVVVDFICETTAGQRVGFQMFMAEPCGHGDLIPVLLGGLAPTMPGLDPEERSDDGTRREESEQG